MLTCCKQWKEYLMECLLEKVLLLVINFLGFKEIRANGTLSLPLPFNVTEESDVGNNFCRILVVVNTSIMEYKA